MILDLDRLRMEYTKIYQVDEGSARREPLRPEKVGGCAAV